MEKKVRAVASLEFQEVIQVLQVLLQNQECLFHQNQERELQANSAIIYHR
jgi:hypothetical protein